jgi:uncharacterized membrane protein YkvA (DUF1232 family)
MANNSQGSPAPDSNLGILGELFQNGRLAWRLLRDQRVPSLLKFVVPGLMGAYLLMPVDLVPDIIPVLGQLDDLAVLALAVKLFIELAPQDVVRELRRGMTQRGASSTQAEGGSQKKNPDDVVDVEYRVVD